MARRVVPTKAARLMAAIARIGYDPEVALCDLLDNSIDAGATYINIECMTPDGASKDIAGYVIADNGRGMTEETLLNAFALGAERDYKSGSLGKFGIGMKSAGLSLGNKIKIITKTKGSPTTVGVLSMLEIQSSTSGEYEVDIDD